MNQPNHPFKMPWCTYPTANDYELHGVYNLPTNLPLVDFTAAKKFRSQNYVPIPINKLDKPQILELVRLIANSFASNEPMNRHVHPPRQIPKEIINASHQDVFGNDPYGTWTTENILFWFIRLVIITDPSHPKEAVQMSRDPVSYTHLTLPTIYSV